MTDNLLEFRSARLFSITGRVQGVWFRDSAKTEALHLGIKGYAINLDDGSVEVYAVGSRDRLEALETWLRQGPPLAAVEAVRVKDVPVERCEGFVTG
ncbi:MAG: acylphosphatase [Pseudomonadota bacterium]